MMNPCRLLTRLILTALAVSPALANFHLVSSVSDALVDVVAVPSNKFNCNSIVFGAPFIGEDGFRFPYESDFFKTSSPVCGVQINFYATTEEGASYKMYQDGGGFIGYCYPQWARELILCDGHSVRAMDDYVCYSYVCELFHISVTLRLLLERPSR